MSLDRQHVLLIGGWFALVAVVTVAATSMGFTLSTTTAVLVGAVACVPPVIALMVFRGAPDRSTNELIYDAENPTANTSEKRS